MPALALANILLAPLQVMAAVEEGADFDARDISHLHMWNVCHFAAADGDGEEHAERCEILSWLKKKGADVQVEDLAFKSTICAFPHP